MVGRYLVNNDGYVDYIMFERSRGAEYTTAHDG